MLNSVTYFHHSKNWKKGKVVADIFPCPPQNISIFFIGWMVNKLTCLLLRHIWIFFQFFTIPNSDPINILMNSGILYFVIASFGLTFFNFANLLSEWWYLTVVLVVLFRWSLKLNILSYACHLFCLSYFIRCPLPFFLF